MIADKLLDNKSYHTYTAVTWETSDLRNWLNNTFYNKAFNTDEKTGVKEVTNTNPNNPTYNTNGGNNTVDKVFSLSIDEVRSLFISDADRQASATNYAKNVGNDGSTLYVMSNGMSFWWLRTPGRYQDRATYVRNSGDVFIDGMGANYAVVAVRPALYINLQSTLFQANESSITWDLSGKSLLDESTWTDMTTYREGYAVTLPTIDNFKNVTKFLGWQINNSGEIYKEIPATMTGNLKLKAVFDGYTVEFMYDATTYTSIPTQQVVPNGKVTAVASPLDPTGKNRTFLGWAIEPDAKKEDVVDLSKYEITRNTKLYAVFETIDMYDVVFKRTTDEGKGEPIILNCMLNEEYQVETLAPMMSKFTGPNGRPAMYYRYVATEGSTDTPPNDKMILYEGDSCLNFINQTDITFIYEPVFALADTDEAKSFSIKYYQDTAVKKEEICYYNKRNKILTAEDVGVYKKGYHFLGWADKSDKNVVKYNPNDEIKLLVHADDLYESKNNLELYAVLEINKYKIIFSASPSVLTAAEREGVAEAEDVKYELEYEGDNSSKKSPAKDYFKKSNHNLAYYKFHSGTFADGNNILVGDVGRSRIYSNTDFGKLIDENGAVLIYKPVWTQESNETTDPTLNDDERAEKTNDYETFTITYHSNTGDAPDIATVSVYRYDEPAKYKHAKELGFKMQNRRFVGWAETATDDLSAIKYKYNEEFFKKVEEDDANDNIHLYAVWEETCYTLLLTADGLSDVTGDDYSVDVRFSEELTLPGENHFSKTSDGSQYQFVYYQYFKAKLPEYMGGGEVNDVDIARERLYENPTTPYKELTSGNKYEEVILIYRPVFTNKWDGDSNGDDANDKKNFKISYYAAANTEPVTISYSYNKEAFTAKAVDIGVKKVGFHNTGWTGKHKGVNVRYSEDEELFFDANEDPESDNDIDLYAVWEENVYTVRFTATPSGTRLDDVESSMGDVIHTLKYSDVAKSPVAGVFTKFGNEDENYNIAYFEYVEGYKADGTVDASIDDSLSRERIYVNKDFTKMTTLHDVELVFKPVFTMISNETTEPGLSGDEHDENTHDYRTFVITYYSNYPDTAELDEKIVPIEYKYNEECILPKAEDDVLGMKVKHYKFMGWAKSATTDLDLKANDAEDELFIKADAVPEQDNDELKFYALWDAKGYTITYSKNGLDGVSGNDFTEYVKFFSNVPLPSSGYTKSGNYDFTYYEYSHATDKEGNAISFNPTRARLYQSPSRPYINLIDDEEHDDAVLIYKPIFTLQWSGSGGDDSDEQDKKTFNINYFASTDDSVPIHTETYYYNQEAYICKADAIGVKKTGYHNLGWALISNPNVVEYGENVEIIKYVENDANNDMNLYAVWEENTYTVTFTGNANVIGHENAGINGATVSYTVRYTEAKKSPIKGHFTKENYNIAYYEYVSGYNPDYNTGSLDDSINDTLSRKRIYVGAEFKGLTDLMDIELIFRPVFTMISNEDTEPGLEPQEHDENTKENETFIFTYHSNDGNDKTVVETYRYDKEAWTKGHIWSREGYDLIGWDTDPNKDPKDSVPPEFGLSEELFRRVEDDVNNTIDLYAVWSIVEYTVVFTKYNDNMITGDDVELTVVYNDDKYAPSATAFEKNGSIDKHTFAYYEYVRTENVDSGIRPKRLRFYAGQKIGNLTLVRGARFIYRAVFTSDGDYTDDEDINNALTFNVVYHANDTTGRKKTITASYSEAYFIEANSYVRSGYSFKGYSESANSTQVIYKPNDELFMRVEDSRVKNLYCVWHEEYTNYPAGGRSGGGSGGGGSSYSMDPTIGVPGKQYSKYYVQNEDIYVISRNRSTGGDGNNGNKMNGKWFYEVETSRWKYIADPTDKFFNPQIEVLNGFLVNGMYMLGNNKFVYSFDSTGYLETGFLSKNGKIYYAETKGDFIGALEKGENEINGMIYTFNDYTAELIPPKDNIYTVTKGVPKLNPATNTYHYYVQHDDGQLIMLTNGMYKIKAEDGKYYNYYFDIFGNVITGIVSYNNKMHYMKEDGKEDETMVAALNN